MRHLFVLICLLAITDLHAQIKLDPSNKFMVDTRTGKPFFWMGDTGWELFHRMTREDAVYYLDKRKAQGFNLVMAVALAELDGLTQPNRYGDVPFKNLETLECDTTPGSDPTDPEAYDYWDHVDYIVEEAAKRGLYLGLLPTWGDKVAYLWGAGPRIFNAENAYDYAKKLAERYKNQWNIVWITGGDRPGFYEREGRHHDDRPVWRAMAKAIQDVFGNDVFIAYHPGGSAESSSAWFHEEEWLTMNAIQSGHGSRTYPIWDYIRKDLKKQPYKPTMDIEPNYEYHPMNPWDDQWTREGRGFHTSTEIRSRMYRGVFAGGIGATYGNHSVWQFLDTTRYEPVFTGDIAIHWREALDAEVAGQIHYLKDLMLDHPDWDRVEDSLLITSPRGSDYRDLVLATRNQKATYALIHLPQPEPVSIDFDRLADGRKKVSWFNPSTGRYKKARNKRGDGIKTFTPPDNGQQDWVLVINVK